MRTVLAGLLLACGAAHAQVIECPPAYPLEPMALAGNSKAIVQQSRLSGGGVYLGNLGGNGEMHGDQRSVKGGINVQYGFGENEPKWFVCGYGRDRAIGSWRAIDAKATTCTMQQRTRGDVVTVRAECK